MTTCEHHVKFHIKQLFVRMPEYKCRNCGATVMMGKRLKTAIQAINVFFIVIMIAAAISSSLFGPGMVGFIYYLILMAGVLAAYLITNVIMITKGNFVSLITQDGQPADSVEKQGPATSKPEDTSGYTAEQLELMALYDSYVEKNYDPSGNTNVDSDEGNVDERQQTVNLKPPVRTSASQQSARKVSEDTCEHVPLTTWRTFLPGNGEFICSKCEQPITIEEDKKRILNIILLLFSIIVFAASISYESIQLWQLALIALAILIICSLIQFFFVKKSKFVIKKD